MKPGTPYALNTRSGYRRSAVAREAYPALYTVAKVRPPVLLKAPAALPLPGTLQLLMGRCSQALSPPHGMASTHRWLPVGQHV